MGGNKPQLAQLAMGQRSRNRPQKSAYEPRAEAQPRTKTSWSAAAAEAALGLLVLIFRFNTLLNHIPHSTQGHGRYERHPLLLIRAQRLVERVPSIGELLEVSGTLSQCVRSTLHQLDRIALVSGSRRAFAHFHSPL